LCVEAHSAADYFELVKEFDTIMLTGVPLMSMKDRNEARRFITLLDALYENHIGLVMSSETAIADIFNARAYDAGEAVEQSSGPHSMLADTDVDPASLSSPLFTGEEEVFAFHRAVSRLMEMSTKQWAMACRHPLLRQYATNISGHKDLEAKASTK
ncbi:ATPase, partial [Spiromyces aspiralis]